MKDRKERSHDPRSLELLAFGRQAGELQGQWPLAGMSRLAASLAAAPDTAVAWQAAGRQVPVTGGEPQTWLDLTAQAQVPLQCQRCLQAMNQTLDVQRHFRFVRSEDEAAELDEESEDDVLALPPRLDLHELLEDELILALPLVPRHDICPNPLPMSAADPDVAAEETAPHPFAALAALRGRKPGPG